MHARSTTIRGNPSSLDQAIAYMRDEVLPAMQRMDGFVGLSMLCERDTGRCVATSAWTDEQAMRASADKIHPMREKLVEEFGGEPEVQEWEIAVLHRDHRSGEGACARVTWTRVPADQMNGLEEHWRSRVMPRLMEMPGFCSLSYMMDRQAGLGVGTVSFDSRESMEATREQAREMRDEGNRTRGVEFMDVAEMDLVLAHLRVPETV
jgi:heme-degrading monooxygenase HmoA